ncbi:MAG: SDR family oxidoreductase [Dehalococcoidia bacterium]|nr:SDR family oxidoreductase [Dehalococcoidia bacterium]
MATKYLDGKTAIVTGAGRGIGAEIAKLMGELGANVVVADFGGSVEGTGREAGPADDTVNAILATGGKAVANYADVSDHKQAEDLVRQALDTYGKLDILVNVAGILRERMIFNMSEQEWDDVIRVHLKGTYNTTHFASIHWRTQRQGGRLISFSSGAAFGSAGQPNYATAKAGLIGFAKSCANALGRYGVTSNAILPGAATRMTDRNLGNQQATREGDAESERVEGTFRDPANVAPMVAWLCSDDAAHVTGRSFGVRGFEVVLYHDYVPERQIWWDSKWPIDKLFEVAPSSIFAGMQGPSGNRPAGATNSGA